MKIRGLLLGVVALAAVAGLAYLMMAIRGLEGGNETAVRGLFRELETLDADLNEEVARSRLIVDIRRDALYETLEATQARLEQLAAGGHALSGISAAVDQALAGYLATMQEKVALGREYERRNLRLINALELIPSVSDEVLEQLPAGPDYQPAANLVVRFNKEILAYGMLPAPENEAVVEDLLYTIGQSQVEIPDALRTPFQRLSSLGNTVLIDKAVAQQGLESLLAFPSGQSLAELQTAYGGYRAARLEQAQLYRWALLGYAVFLLLGLAWLGLRLRASYRRLDAANDELQEANERLEERVANRTQHLEQTLAELKSSQAQLVQSEKMASLGQMVAGVTHEINTPLGYVRSNNEIVSASLQELGALLGCYRDALALLDNPQAEFEATARALQELESLRQELDPEVLLDELRQLVSDSHHGLVQIGELVANLKDFSRLDRSRTEFVNLNDGLDSALNICGNMLKHRIEVQRDYGELPQVECAPSQINQIFLNLITNASQAIEGEGRITLVTRAMNNAVHVRIRDTGHGMDAQTREQIFDPFYTTKPLGQGTGLGLSIVYRIVKEHGGRIAAASVPGKGTEFSLILPLRQQAQASDWDATEMQKAVSA